MDDKEVEMMANGLPRPRSYSVKAKDSEKATVGEFVLESMEIDDVAFLRAPNDEVAAALAVADGREDLEKYALDRKQCIVLLPPGTEVLEVQEITGEDDE